ncbi:hypothetical protein [Parahalioglobus pacificus]|uniref:Uncharacterized protein n=1 Tax=Parahalioglobus pacificus TaxID=930806 RepID=A0A918XGC4_9GAMM|nr:hypothetical protein [Halioglobus pacificus]GHD29562.1 hypothetical protein GCM10007053_10310 [Halioglobus pacificus]
MLMPLREVVMSERNNRRTRATAELKQRLLSDEGGCVTAPTLEAMFSLESGSVTAYEASGEIFSVMDGDQRLYPCWVLFRKLAEWDDLPEDIRPRHPLFTDGKPYPVLKTLLEMWRPENPYRYLTFFLGDHPALSVPGQCPLDMMREGRNERLLELWEYEAELGG